MTDRFHEANDSTDDDAQSERISGKGDLTRRRTVMSTDALGESGPTVSPDVDPDGCEPGRVLSVQGLHSTVQAVDGSIVTCATRRLLKTLTTDQRHVVAAGDRVLFRRASGDDGVIERIQPRHGVIARTSRGRKHVIVANVDLLVIVTSCAMPDLKPHLIDRMLVTAESAGISPLVCLNKIDLVDPAELQPLIGTYAQLGYAVLTVSAVTGQGVPALRSRMVGQQSTVVGQSGVGKTSLLNAIEPGLGLRVREVSEDNQKGRHTTTTATLIPLTDGGSVADTPGIRQFRLWDISPEEVPAWFPELRPYVSHCRFPDCTHTHELDCAVKDAVADHQIDVRRYDSYCHLLDEDRASR